MQGYMCVCVWITKWQIQRGIKWRHSKAHHRATNAEWQLSQRNVWWNIEMHLSSGGAFKVFYTSCPSAALLKDTQIGRGGSAFVYLTVWFSLLIQSRSNYYGPVRQRGYIQSLGKGAMFPRHASTPTITELSQVHNRWNLSLGFCTSDNLVTMDAPVFPRPSSW